VARWTRRWLAGLAGGSLDSGLLLAVPIWPASGRFGPKRSSSANHEV
jgi:hypothetical protein